MRDGAAKAGRRSGAFDICPTGFGLGLGRWNIKAAIVEGVPVPALSAALHQCFSSRRDADYQGKLLCAISSVAMLMRRVGKQAV